MIKLQQSHYLPFKTTLSTYIRHVLNWKNCKFFSKWKQGEELSPGDVSFRDILRGSSNT